jgi:hypothetical protein
VPITLEQARVVGLREGVGGNARRLDLSCKHVPLQEGWELETG